MFMKTVVIALSIFMTIISKNPSYAPPTIIAIHKTPSNPVPRQKLGISTFLAWLPSNPNSVALPPVVGGRVASGTSRDPTMRLLPPGSRLTGVPEMVTPDPPGTSVKPSITTPDGWTVKVKAPTVNILGAGV